MKTLVASRNPEFRQQVSGILSGHCVVDTDRGSDLVRRVLQEAFDLVVIDVDLSGMDGVDSLSVVRRVRPKVPVVMVSESISEEAESQIARVGVFYHFHKPLYDEDFLKVVEAISRREHSAEGRAEGNGDYG